MADSSERPHLLLVEPLLASTEAALGVEYVIYRQYDEREADRIASDLPRIQAVVTGGGSGLTRERLRELPSLGIVAINGVGTDKIDLALARTRRRSASSPTTLQTWEWR